MASRPFWKTEIGAVRNQKLMAAQRLSESDALIDELHQQLQESPEYVQSELRSVPNTGRDALRNQLYELQVQRIRLEQSLNPSHPKLLMAKANEQEAADLLSGDTSAERSETVNALEQSPPGSGARFGQGESKQSRVPGEPRHTCSARA